MERIKIYSSKKKSFLLLLGSIVFVVLGIWLLLDAENFTGWEANNPIIAKGIGLVSILFFGLGVFISSKRLFKSELALIITSEGVNVNPKKSLLDFIRWEDIQKIEEIKIQSTRIVIIRVKNPQHWIDEETSSFRKKLMQFNLTNYNSPFNISAAGLDITSEKLVETLNINFNKYKTEI